MKICVVSPSYPTSKTILFVFVDQLCKAFADKGVEVSIIAPQSITRNLKYNEPFVKMHSKIYTNNGNIIDLYRPIYFSAGRGRFGNLTAKFFNNAVYKVFESFKVKPDVCYGHFWSSIYALFPIAVKYNIPLFGASGEECVKDYDTYTSEQKCAVSSILKGLINVSTKNRDECVSLGLVPNEKTHIIPNAVDLELFRGRDKKCCRKLLGLNTDDFVISFVGQFVPRKGTLRICEALNKLHDNKIKAIFIGSGIEDPQYEGIVFKGRVQHDDIADYLYASDVYVMPSENEGCSNAIIEAMACGLPVISTDAPFNYDILNSSNSILVDCHNIDQIAAAIRTLKDNPQLRKTMSESSFRIASNLSISMRAERILQIISNNLR